MSSFDKKKKNCSRCKKLKLLKEFYDDNHRKDGKRSWCKSCIIEYHVEWNEANPGKRSQYNKISRDKLKAIVYEHYGNKCKCCGEIIIEFLSIDHKHNNGGEFRKKLKKGSGNFYRWIIKNNFPKDLQLLCMNCNWGKRFLEVCPHKIRKNRHAI